ncbi:MAG: PilT/PilU family type 4a pilus ATPase [Myxococcota bacterium]
MADERFVEILRRAMHLGASDIHLHAGAPIGLRLNGELVVKGSPLPPSDCDAMLRSVLNEHQQRRFDEQGEVDFSFSSEGIGRFRCNIYQQNAGTDGVFRVIPTTPPSFNDLRLPEHVREFTRFKDGLVVIVGPSGSGKSSTMAAMVDSINTTREDHIIMVEEPTEYIHTSKRGVVNQRQVRKHTESYSNALRAALREDPDVIAVGELRDEETISLAMTAAETGHLVISTLHTSNAIQTVDRLINAFSPLEQSRVRTALSQTLRVVLCQKLIQTIDGKSRVAAFEIMVNTPPVAQLIRDNETLQIKSIMELSANQGMCLFDQSLQGLVRQGLISLGDALRHSDSPDSFQA